MCKKYQFDTAFISSIIALSGCCLAIKNFIKFIYCDFLKKNLLCTWRFFYKCFAYYDELAFFFFRICSFDNPNNNNFNSWLYNTFNFPPFAATYAPLISFYHSWLIYFGSELTSTLLPSYLFSQVGCVTLRAPTEILVFKSVYHYLFFGYYYYSIPPFMNCAFVILLPYILWLMVDFITLNPQ